MCIALLGAPAITASDPGPPENKSDTPSPVASHENNISPGLVDNSAKEKATPGPNVTTKNVTAHWSFDGANSSENVEFKEEIPVTIESGDKDEILTGEDVNGTNNGSMATQSYEYGDSDVTHVRAYGTYQDMYSELNVDHESGWSVTANAQGETHLAFDTVPESVEFSSEVDFYGISVSSVSIPPGVDMDVDGSSAEVTWELDSSGFDKSESWHSISHEYTGEASSYIALYGVSQTDSATFYYEDNNAVTLSHEVGDTCVTILDC